MNFSNLKAKYPRIAKEPKKMIIDLESWKGFELKSITME